MEKASLHRGTPLHQRKVQDQCIAILGVTNILPRAAVSLGCWSASNGGCAFDLSPSFAIHSLHGSQQITEAVEAGLRRCRTSLRRLDDGVFPAFEPLSVML